MVIVYVFDFPTQAKGDPFVGVTVIVAVIGLDVVLVATKLGTLPVPLLAKLMAVLLFVHVAPAPAGVLVIIVDGTVAPAHAA